MFIKTACFGFLTIHLFVLPLSIETPDNWNQVGIFHNVLVTNFAEWWIHSTTLTVNVQRCFHPMGKIHAISNVFHSRHCQILPIMQLNSTQSHSDRTNKVFNTKTIIRGLHLNIHSNKQNPLTTIKGQFLQSCNHCIIVI